MWIYASGFPKAQDIGKAIDKRMNKGQDQTVKADYNSNRDGVSVDLTINGVRCPVCKKDSAARYSCDKGQECGMIYKAQSPEAQAWSGWKTALKPAHEPIVMARKPFKGSCIDNVLEHGTGALNIDATRIETVGEKEKNWTPQRQSAQSEIYLGGAKPGDSQSMYNEAGRFPSNVFGEIPDYQKYFYCPKVSRAERHCGFEQTNIPTAEGGMWDVDGSGIQYNRAALDKKPSMQKGSLDHIPTDSDGMLDKGVLYQHTKGGSLDHIPSGIGGGNPLMYDEHGKKMYSGKNVAQVKDSLAHIPAPFGDVKGAYQDGERFAAKHQTLQKGSLDHIPTAPGSGSNQMYGEGQGALHKRSSVGNNHPTVKPVALMSYLVKLVTPEGGKVLDPFNGSGSTGMACVEHGFEYTGCELDPAYVEIATKRINGWYNKTQPDNNFNELFEGDKP